MAALSDAQLFSPLAFSFNLSDLQRKEMWKQAPIQMYDQFTGQQKFKVQIRQPVCWVRSEVYLISIILKFPKGWDFIVSCTLLLKPKLVICWWWSAWGQHMPSNMIYNPVTNIQVLFSVVLFQTVNGNLYEINFFDYFQCDLFKSMDWVSQLIVILVLFLMSF